MSDIGVLCVLFYSVLHEMRFSMAYPFGMVVFFPLYLWVRLNIFILRL